MNKLYTFAKTITDTTESITLPTRTFKGDTEITFNFDGVIETGTKLLAIRFNFGDDTSLTKNYNPDADTLFSEVKHTFTSSNDSYMRTYICQVILIYSSFKTCTFILPIRVAQASFQSEYGNLTVKSAQFTDSLIGNMLVVLESDYHNLYNVHLLSNLSAAAAEPQEIDLLATLDNNLFATNFDYNIRVKH